MSKQSEAKAKQNYQDKPLSKRCRECKNLIVTTHGISFFNEKIFCDIGEFKVKANAICDLFESVQ